MSANIRLNPAGLSVQEVYKKLDYLYNCCTMIDAQTWTDVIMMEGS